MCVLLVREALPPPPPSLSLSPFHSPSTALTQLRFVVTFFFFLLNLQGLHYVNYDICTNIFSQSGIRVMAKYLYVRAEDTGSIK